jgi:type I restriction enzyme S subunit
MSNVPKLRFREFGGEWEEKRIGECIELLTDYHANGSYEKLKENVELLDTPNFAIMIRTTNFEQNDFIKNLIYITEDAYDYLKKSKVYEDDIIINKIANAGATYIMPKIEQPVSLGMNIFLLRAKSAINKKFLFSKIKWEEYRLKALSSGTSTKTITKDDVRGFKLNLPSKPEQEKIASFLTSVDTKIEQLTKKEILLQEYKKGVMNKIFNQEIRFKADDGSEFSDWEQKALGSYLKHKSIKNKDKSIDLVLSVSNKKGFITQDEQFDGYEVASKDTSNYKIVKKEEYAYNPSRINVGSVARLQNFDKGIVSPMYVIFKLTNELNPIFFDNLYQTHRFKHLIKIGCSGSVRNSLNFNDMANFRVKIPCIKEQTKIANFLSSIDKKIENTKNVLEKTKEFKKALLQQMFV